MQNFRFILPAMITAIILLFSSVQIANAQTGIGDIFGDIFKNPQQRQNNAIEIIPVDIVFDNNIEMQAESILVVTALAPAPANQRRAKPLFMGETRLLIDDMSSPMNIVIAVPSKLARQIPYARIEAKIINQNGITRWRAIGPASYDGMDSAKIRLEPVTTPAPTRPQPYPDQGSDVISSIVKGKVSVQGHAPGFRGSVLTVRLREDGLAGGKQTIFGEKRIDIDQKSPPYDFEILIPYKRNSKTNTPKVLEAWIEDWAGRKTHILGNKVDYKGADRKYNLKLINNSASPAPYDPPYDPDIGYGNKEIISGKARFDAFKGLPRGARLIVELERRDIRALPAIIATNEILLDGLSGDVDFRLEASTRDIDPNMPPPYLRARIIDMQGNILFSNHGGMELARGENILLLRPSPIY